MPDDQHPPGSGRDHAWFAPSGDAAPRRVPPAGVVYGGTGSRVQTRPRDPYQTLRDMGDEDQLWPLEDPGVPPARPPGSSFGPFLVGLLVGVVLAIVSVVGFQVFRRTPAVETTVPAAGAAVTTAPQPTSAPTTAPPVSTATSVAPATTLPSEVPPIEPSGTPLDLRDLRLAANAIGPIGFGAPAPQALGRLVSSLGEPTTDTGDFVSSGEMGTCPGDTIRVATWGPLAAVAIPGGDGQVLGGFRLDLALGGLETRAATISTLSGLRAGDTVEEMQTIYEDFTIDFIEEPDLGLIFELRRANEADLLLWGPVTSDEPDGIVTGIFSPDPCGS